MTWTVASVMTGDVETVPIQAAPAQAPAGNNFRRGSMPPPTRTL
jgi:hypothetical protein